MSAETTNPYAAFQSVYSPSLLPTILPGTEAIAERSYSPLTATAGYRPIKVPTGLTTQSYQGGELNPETIVYPTSPVPNPNNPGNPILQYGNELPYSQAISTIRDPNAIQFQQSAQQQFNNEAPLVLPQGTTSAPLTPFQQGAENQLGNSLSNYLNRSSKYTIGSLLSGLSSPMQGSMATFAGPGNPSMQQLNGQSLVPTGSQLLSVLGYQQMLAMLNRVSPNVWNNANLSSAPTSAVYRALNSLPYDTVLAIYDMLPMYTKAQVLMMEGIQPGEAISLAESGSPLGLVPNGFLPQRRKQAEAAPAAGLTQKIKNLVGI